MLFNFQLNNGAAAAAVAAAATSTGNKRPHADSSMGLDAGVKQYKTNLPNLPGCLELSRDILLTICKTLVLRDPGIQVNLQFQLPVEGKHPSEYQQEQLTQHQQQLSQEPGDEQPSQELGDEQSSQEPGGEQPSQEQGGEQGDEQGGEQGDEQGDEQPSHSQGNEQSSQASEHPSCAAEQSYVNDRAFHSRKEVPQPSTSSQVPERRLVMIRKTKIRQVIKNLQQTLTDITNMFHPYIQQDNEAENYDDDETNFEDQTTLLHSENNTNNGDNNDDDNDENSDDNNDNNDDSSSTNYTMTNNSAFQYEFLNLNAMLPIRKPTGFVVGSVSSCNIEPGRIRRIQTGLKIQIPEGYYCTVTNYKTLLEKDVTVATKVLCDSGPHVLNIELINHSGSAHTVASGEAVALLNFSACNVPPLHYTFFDRICCEDCINC